MTESEFRKIIDQFGFIAVKMIDTFETKIEKNIAEIDYQELKSYFDCISPEYRLPSGAITEDAEQTLYMWVSTPFDDAQAHTPVYFAFRRRDIESEEWFVYMIATYGFLENNMSKFVNGTLEPKRSEEDTFLHQLYDLLLLKNNWGALPGYKVLMNFIKAAENRIMVCPEYRLDSVDGKKMTYNTGLIDTYGNDIYIMIEVDETGIVLHRTIAPSKNTMRAAGFNEVKCKAVQFYEDASELILKANINDFDLEDVGHLKHALEKRIDRFPKDCRELGGDILFQRLKASLEFDLKMVNRNPYWAAAFYNIKGNTIHHLLPLYITNSFSETPDIAVIINRGEYYYEVATVLKLEDAFANAACLATPPSSWLCACLPAGN